MPSARSRPTRSAGRGRATVQERVGKGVATTSYGGRTSPVSLPSACPACHAWGATGRRTPVVSAAAGGSPRPGAGSTGAEGAAAGDEEATAERDSDGGTGGRPPPHRLDPG